MTFFDLMLVVVAGFAAGVLNSVAGGGTFLSLPALIYVGISPVSANATATLTALPGYVSSAWGFRHDMKSDGTMSLPIIAAIGIAGSVAGSLLLIVTSADTFLWVVPWLLLLATALFAAGPWLVRRLRRDGTEGAGLVASVVTILAVSIYGGYFNGGLGIMLLAAFGFIGYADLHGMNGLKNTLSAVISLVSVVTFVLAGLIAWQPALMMAASATLGGYVGAVLSRQIVRTDLLRYAITAVGLGMAITFFMS